MWVACSMQGEEEGRWCVWVLQALFNHKGKGGESPRSSEDASVIALHFKYPHFHRFLESFVDQWAAAPSYQCPSMWPPLPPIRPLHPRMWPPRLPVQQRTPLRPMSPPPTEHMDPRVCSGICEVPPGATRRGAVAALLMSSETVCCRTTVRSSAVSSAVTFVASLFKGPVTEGVACSVQSFCMFGSMGTAFCPISGPMARCCDKVYCGGVPVTPSTFSRQFFLVVVSLMAT